MKNRLKLLSILLLFPVVSFAQEVEMADQMRAEGKIYVVVGVIVVIFIGLIGYLAALDRKITRLEKSLPPAK